MGSKKAKIQTAPSKPMLRVLAVHRDVTERLEEWSSDLKWSTVAARFVGVLNSLRKGNIEEAEMALNSLYRSTIYEAGGVREYGRNQRGGAPRLFVLLRSKSFFFVAAGLEEGSTGCPEIEVARSRGTQLSKLEPQPSVEAYKKALGREYEVSPIPETGTRETR